ncbi:MAG: hypothetical protein ACLQE9_21705 [Roseiarcus sp.]
MRQPASVLIPSAGLPTPAVEAIVTTGQHVRLKASSPLAREWNLPPGAEGTVICRYRMLARRSLVPERMDVRFGPHKVVWGAPAVEFEPVGETPRYANQH